MSITKNKIIGMVSAAILMATPAFVAIAGKNQPAPSFEVQGLAGGEVISLKQFDGKVVYIDFWASWCAPCLRSFPFMEELNQTYGDRGLVIIAINMDEDPRDAQAFLAEHPVTFFLGQDAAGSIAKSYGVRDLPSSVLIDRDGVIKNVHYGFKPSDREKINTLVSRLL